MEAFDSNLSQQLGLIIGHAAGSRVAVVFFALFAICLGTRLLSGRSPQTVEGGLKTAGVLPHWIPYVGHTLWLAFFPEKIGHARSATQDGIFGLSIGGHIHNIIVKPSLVKGVFSLKRDAAHNHELVMYLVETFFGYPESVRKVHPDVFFRDLPHATNSLMKESYLEDAMSVISQGIESQVSNLVSNDKDVVEKSPWIWRANVVAAPGDIDSFEVDFFSLIRTWVASTASPTIMGTAFLANNPGIIQDLWDFDAGMVYFMMKIPRWIPITVCRKAHDGRYRLRAAAFEFMTALSDVLEGKDPGPRWKDLSDVSEVMWERCKVWRKTRNEMEVWGGGEMSTFWALNVNSNNIIFWLLVHIYSSSSLLARIRSEIAPFTVRSLSSSTPLALNATGIIKSCPLLKASYYESLRLDVGSTTLRTAYTDISITESASDAFNGQPESYLIRKGEFVHIDHSIHQNDPRYFPEPEVFRPERFLFEEDIKNKKDDDIEGGDDVERKGRIGKLVPQQGTIRPFGGGHNVCKGYKFAEREILLYVASVLAVWDAVPVGGIWKIPEHKRASGAYLPKGDIRLTLRRRL